MNTRSSGLPLKSPKSNPEKSKKPIKKSKNSTPPSPHTTTSSSNFEEKPDTKPKIPNPPEPIMARPQDQFDIPMFERTRTVPPTPGSAISAPTLGDDFAVKGHHLKMIQDNSFDGRMKSDPHKHIAKFTELCKMFKYGQGTEEGVKLSLFPSSLTGEALMWFEELEENTIRTWAELREAFVSRFFPPALGRKLLRDIRGFRQDEGETIIEAWIRLKEMIRNCHGHGLDKEQIIEISFYGLDHQGQKELDLAGGGNFMYKTTNAAYKMMEDMVLTKLARDSNCRDRRSRKTVAFAEDCGSSINSAMMAEIKALSDRIDNKFTRIDTQFGRIEKDIKVVANGCDHCGGMHYSEDCDIPGVHAKSRGYEEAKYVQNQYQGSFQQGGYQNRNSGNSSTNPPYNTHNSSGYQNRWQRNNPPYQPQQSRAEGSSSLHADNKDAGLMSMMKSFIETQSAKNDSLTNHYNLLNEKISGLHDKIDQGQRNQQASIFDLEKRIDRISEKNAT